MTDGPQKTPSRHMHGQVEPMKSMIDRYKAQVLLQAGHTQKEVAIYADMGQRTARRIEHEPPVEDLDDRAEKKKRRIGRPSKTAAFRKSVEDMLKSEPDLMSLEFVNGTRILHNCGIRNW